MTMIEKVARAMAEKYAHYLAPDDLVSFCTPSQPSSGSLMARGLHKKLDDDAYCQFWEIFVPDARAAIETMRNPSDEMLDVDQGEYGETTSSRDVSLRVWQGMIDKALNE